MKTLKDRALEAYEAGAVAPGFVGWGNVDKGCGCAITAISLHEQPSLFPNLFSFLRDFDNYGSDRICEAVGISRPFMLGFTDGFDGMPAGSSKMAPSDDLVTPEQQAEYDAGYAQGKDTREAVFDKYFPDGYVLREGDVNQ